MVCVGESSKKGELAINSSLLQIKAAKSLDQEDFRNLLTGKGPKLPFPAGSVQASLERLLNQLSYGINCQALWSLASLRPSKASYTFFTSLSALLRVLFRGTRVRSKRFARKKEPASSTNHKLVLLSTRAVLHKELRACRGFHVNPRTGKGSKSPSSVSARSAKARTCTTH